MGLLAKDDGWRISDKWWQQMESLLPAPKPHPLGCHNPPVPNRSAMEAILFVLRTGIQWNALDGTGICSCSSSYRRFREWSDAGVFASFWRAGLLRYDETQGIDWDWLAMDGAMTKAPLAGTQMAGPNPTDRGKQGVKRSLLTEGAGIPVAVTMEGANRHDMKLVQSTLDAIMTERPALPKTSPRGCVWTRATTLMKCATSSRSLDSRRTSAPGAKRPKRSRRTSVSRPGAGWWSARTAG